MRILKIGVLLLCLASAAAYSAVPDGAEALYYVQSALEGQSPAITRARITVLDSEKVGGKVCRWWQLTMERRVYEPIAVRVLSEEIPMTSATAPGKIFRYIYAPSADIALDYREDRTGEALLPQFPDFVKSFLPVPSPEARYRDGFATAGRLAGHVLVWNRNRRDFSSVPFDNVKVLSLRSDLMIAPQGDQRVDNDPSKPPDQQDSRPYSDDDYRTAMAAGFNYFRPTEEQREWLQNEPVFFQGGARFPQDFYRSNWVPHRMYLDEPVIRFGWDKHIPGTLPGPEAYSEAIRIRFEAMQRPSRRVLKTLNYPEEGFIELIEPPTPVWETQYWAAFYQLAGGAPGTVHEGRYRKRGYGYYPELLFGEGLESLSDREMFNYYYAFLRGAARAFDGWWGMSIYSESDPKYRLPAMIEAYNKGAKMIWFWTWADVDFNEQIRLAKGLSEYAAKHPRPSPEETVRAAEVGIALPPGYCFDERAIWGMNREQLNDKGVSYGDIAAAAIWEGMICSRRGMEYDFLVDHPGIEKLGYRWLHIVQADGSVKSIPKRTEVRAPRDLTLRLEPTSGLPKAGDMSTPAEFRIENAGSVKVDADFSEWDGAQWVELDTERDGFADTFDKTLYMTIPDPIPDVKDDFEVCEYLGFSYDDPDPKLFEKHRLDVPPTQEGVVIEAVKPGSPADEAGLRPGDILYEMSGRRTRWVFEIYRVLQDYRKRPGMKIEALIKRNGFEFLGGPEDISARIAFVRDDRYFYIAAEVRDDVHRQDLDGWDMWKHDSVQVGIDPILERSEGYSEYSQEVGLILRDGDPLVWRWEGCRGQPIGASSEWPLGREVKAAAKRLEGRTIYEAAIPIAELQPLSPDMWPKCGMNIVVNDCDEGESRKARLELRQGAMTAGKHPDDFAVFELAPSETTDRLSAALFWERRCFQPGGHAALTVAVASAQVQKAVINAELRSLDDPGARPATAKIEVPVTRESMEHALVVSSSSPPGRYRLSVIVKEPGGRVAAHDALPVYVYP